MVRRRNMCEERQVLTTSRRRARRAPSALVAMSRASVAGMRFFFLLFLRAHCWDICGGRYKSVKMVDMTRTAVSWSARTAFSLPSS